MKKKGKKGKMGKLSSVNAKEKRVVIIIKKNKKALRHRMQWPGV